LLGLVGNGAFGWWWSDAVAALLIAAFLARDGWTTLSS
jgi:divalent metal cation (Fe/Co/Zn/Cd) transporter